MSDFQVSLCYLLVDLFMLINMSIMTIMSQVLMNRADEMIEPTAMFNDDTSSVKCHIA